MFDTEAMPPLSFKEVKAAEALESCEPTPLSKIYYIQFCSISLLSTFDEKGLFKSRFFEATILEGEMKLRSLLALVESLKGLGVGEAYCY